MNHTINNITSETSSWMGTPLVFLLISPLTHRFFSSRTIQSTLVTFWSRLGFLNFPAKPNCHWEPFPPLCRQVAGLQPRAHSCPQGQPPSWPRAILAHFPSSVHTVGTCGTSDPGKETSLGLEVRVGSSWTLRRLLTRGQHWRKDSYQMQNGNNSRVPGSLYWDATVKPHSC